MRRAKFKIVRVLESRILREDASLGVQWFPMEEGLISLKNERRGVIEVSDMILSCHEGSLLTVREHEKRPVKQQAYRGLCGSTDHNGPFSCSRTVNNETSWQLRTMHRSFPYEITSPSIGDHRTQSDAPSLKNL